MQKFKLLGDTYYLFIILKTFATVIVIYCSNGVDSKVHICKLGYKLGCKLGMMYLVEGIMNRHQQAQTQPPRNQPNKKRAFHYYTVAQYYYYLQY